MIATAELRYSATSFADLPGWQYDDFLPAWTAFLASCKPVMAAAQSGGRAGPAEVPAGLLSACAAALDIARSGQQTGEGAQAFFEQRFTPHEVVHGGPAGLLTGYYEPVLDGAREPAGAYRVPIYLRPADLVNMVAESERGAKSAGFTHMRRTADGLKPYLTRSQIEQGGLAEQGLELMYFADPVDVFFMQVQGSGRVRLPSGELVRVTYDGKNGYPYTSVGRVLIDTGDISETDLTLDALKAWLRADPERARPVLWRNESYVFFRELAGAEAERAMGALGIPLHDGRSLAVDTAYHTLGTPVFVSAPSIRHADGGAGGEFNRLMIAHDVGSAIKGPERGDIYFGSGDAAGHAAGITKHLGKFFVLLQRGLA